MTEAYLRKTMAFGIAILFAGAVLAGDFEDGLAAEKREDYATSLARFRIAAQQGNCNARNFIGLMYWEGRGVAQDYEEAKLWYKFSADI